ncbi:MAG: hypothetical protein HN704_17960 [Bacteroidetes bacterium]|jgi:hypothetical protein|nr:hypothetical protein [Bacteroidota bacterium]MBT6685490.1 hypothetical protein [Bacteroidota bacterium]MBT7144597.1 hypothetical protein [Bacteroidota bacterium]MBT7493487.1 hypothetical protein [Bacteroidota bacterium]
MKQILLSTLLFLFILNANSQNEKNWTLNGYISNIQSVMFESYDEDWVNDNVIHNRLNFKWYPNNSLKFATSIRNRLLWGSSFQYFPEYAKSIEESNSYFDLNRNILSEESFALNSTIDRLYLDYTIKDLQITLGRQRINWGQNFIWNPNDIFNSYSFFEVDYTERPGSDAIRIQYYTSYSSSAEFAMNCNSDKEITLAGLYRFNKWNYDIQLLGGLIKETEIFAGLGWSGDIKTAGFTGELSYFVPKKMKDTSGVLLFALSGNYTFSNSLMLQIDYIYNEYAKSYDISQFGEMLNLPQSEKAISFTEHTYFLSAGFPINPLINASVSAMYFPKLDGIYIGGSLDYSLKDNLNVSFISQFFDGQFGDERSKFFMGFLKLQLSF